MEIEDNILALLGGESGLKGYDVAQRLGVGTSVVNAALYRLEAKHLVWKNNNYLWFSKQGKEAPQTEEPSSVNAAEDLFAASEKIDPRQAQASLKKLTDLRQKLLDLSNRNKLLNFSHSVRSRQQLRIIDEVPDEVFSALDGERVFQLLPLPPEPDAEWEDEQTPEFTAALEAAKSEDENFFAALAAVEDGQDDHAENRLQRLERELRDRVRAVLQLPPRSGRVAFDVLAHARRHGLPPEYELAARTAQRPVHRDKFLQTLLLPEALDRKATALVKTHNESLNEMGLNTLHLIFGFLEWREQTVDGRPAEKEFYAPLLLVPVEIERITDDGSHVFTVKSAGQDAETNVTLAERLRRDFKLELPTLAEEERPEAYFLRVERVIRKQPQWRLRRFITLAHVSFHRLVMWKDLEPATAQDQQLHLHHLLRELLGGRSTSDDAPLVPHDEADATHPPPNLQPLLIRDADSSQHEAIVRALRGDNLVIQGPPGTGKSETITNLIAAALAAGKRVLFVAEKMAALNVVQKRLTDSGLGDFCLELHSTKTNKKAVLDVVRKRLQLHHGRFHHQRPPQRNPQLLADYRVRLTRYANSINQTYGESGFTIHQIIWRCLQRQELALPREWKRVDLPGIVTLTPDELAVRRKLIEAFSAALDGDTECEPTLAQTWAWVSAAELTPFDAETLLDHVAQLHNAVEALEIVATKRLLAGEPDRPATLAEVRELHAAAKAIPPLSPEVNGELLAFLATAPAREDLRQVCRYLQKYRGVGSDGSFLRHPSAA